MIWIWLLIGFIIFLILLSVEDEWHLLEFISDAIVWGGHAIMIAFVLLNIIYACNEEPKKQKEVEYTRVIVDSAK